MVGFQEGEPIEVIAHDHPVEHNGVVQRPRENELFVTTVRESESSHGGYYPKSSNNLSLNPVEIQHKHIQRDNGSVVCSVIADEANRAPVGVKELPASQNQVNTLLEQTEIAQELRKTASKARLSRAPEHRDKILKQPPRFKFVSEYHSCVYDPKSETVIEGRWSDTHVEIAQKHGLAVAGDEEKTIRSYWSGEIFAFRAIPQIRMFELGTLQGFSPKDHAVLESLGYTVMTPTRDWILVDFASNTGFRTVKSPISD